ncbi:hypothetical protein PB2503_11544 [Parvularcula bermudensis HTCC2503]|uniref:Uncharacterized protein n=1 Tax=Parvularcula bermudensis (strain ATCC BAA-594 / HTCC2503 / KCTC 12087) TaxID=314260 RepID=E0TCX1_PARBH|nr:cupin domain-containing protein [Parvularcula bermudensis]ADM10354.1 hypothetical protein PB2503_11544 [Parvularcula bermudensis HTCC2503]
MGLVSAFFSVFALIGAGGTGMTGDGPPPPRAQALIDHYDMALIPHEGAWFALNHRSDHETISGAVRGTERRALHNSIYALITARDFSALHRLDTDEYWTYLGGAPAEMLLLHPDGRVERPILGPDPLIGHHPQILVPRGTWMGARPAETMAEGGGQGYTFFSATLAPAFEPAGYEPGDREALSAAYPEAAEMIIALTRPEAGEEAPPTSPTSVYGEGISLAPVIGRTGPVATDALSVTRFRLEAGAALPLLKTAEGTEALIVLDGTGIAEVGETRQSIAPGDIVFMPPILPHRVEAVTDLRFLAVTAPAYDPSDITILEAPPPGSPR